MTDGYRRHRHGYGDPRRHDVRGSARVDCEGGWRRPPPGLAETRGAVMRLGERQRTDSGETVPNMRPATSRPSWAGAGRPATTACVSP